MITNRRIALLAGASITALGVAAPAQAALFPAPATHAGLVTTTDTWIICATDAPDVTPFVPDCLFGEINSGAGPQTATVNAPANGQLEQSGTAATIDYDMINDGDTRVIASATSTDNDATAIMTNGVEQDGTATAGAADLLFDNNARLELIVIADASGGLDSDANASMGDAFYQEADATGGAATVTLRNDSNEGIIIRAQATATGAGAGSTPDANATVADGIFQSADSTTGDASALYLGTGAVTGAGTTASPFTFPLVFDVDATATGSDANANGTLNAGITQDVEAAGTGTGLASIVSNGLRATLDVTASSTSVTAGVDADAFGTFNIVEQDVDSLEDATILLDINGLWDLDAVVSATTAGTGGSTQADLNSTVIDQHADAGTTATSNALAEVTNDSTIDYRATVTATGRGNNVITPGADTEVDVTGIQQEAHNGFGGSATGTGEARVLNRGTMSFIVAGTATTTIGDVPGEANALSDVDVTGVDQSASDLVVFNNTATATGVTAAFTVTGTSTATGQQAADASVEVLGVEQNLEQRGGTARFISGGAFTVSGTATSSALAGALGVSDSDAEVVGYDLGGESAILDFDNNAAFTVSATAVGTNGDTNEALAVGANFDVDTSDVTFADALSGNVRNDGTMTVTATAPDAATAIGIRLASGTNTAVITNTGALNVDAISTGGLGDATGILVETNAGGLAPLATDRVTINNSGNITVRNRGATNFTRGVAIDVEDAPNPAIINLLGASATTAANIYGDILIDAGDVINVDNGETRLTGTINRCSPVPADIIAAAACTEGTLNITNDGVLLLRGQTNTGTVAAGTNTPSYAFVDTFTQAAGGVLALELQPDADGGAQAAGTYPRVIADTATINGILEARITTPDGLFFNTTWNNVIDTPTAATLIGSYDEAAGECRIGGPYTDSIFLSLNCIEENGNVDLALTRTGFDDIAGLNANSLAAAQGLECVYNEALTPEMTPFFADLFFFTDEDEFAVALNQLAGVSYANYLQSFSSLGAHYNDLLDKATNCEVPALAGSVIECRASAPLHVWGQIDYQRRKSDGDDGIGAGDYRSSRATGLIGLDATVAGAAIIGASVGYVRNKTRDYLFGDSIESDGFQLGAYGVYDPGAFYVKAMTTHSWFNGQSERAIDFTPFGASTVGILTGDPDVRLWTFGVHAGARFAMGGNSVVTPFLNFDHIRANLKSFTEEGLVGPALTIDGSAKSTYITPGVRWAGQFGGLVPEATLGYRYRLGDRSPNFTAGFFGADEDCLFDVQSGEEKRGTILAGLSVGGKLGRADLRLGYEGEFASGITSHAGNLRIVFPIGGRAAPAVLPPPPVMAPPPPPPVEAAPPPPPPPPPPPVERGERGR